MPFRRLGTNSVLQHRQYGCYCRKSENQCSDNDGVIRYACFAMVYCPMQHMKMIIPMMMHLPASLRRVIPFYSPSAYLYGSPALWQRANVLFSCGLFWWGSCMNSLTHTDEDFFMRSLCVLLRLTALLSTCAIGVKARNWWLKRMRLPFAMFKAILSAPDSLE